MNEFETLTELFTKFPGIGPRQARRFVFFLLRQNSGYRKSLINAIENVVQNTHQCKNCLKYTSYASKYDLCNICSSKNRDSKTVMLVEKDIDIDQIEKSNMYNGVYFVLGGTMSLSGKKNFMREKELELFFKKHTFDEIILALSTTVDGEYTTSYLEEKLSLYCNTITRLGRGLSTGAEVEYADPSTLTQALKNRE